MNQIITAIAKVREQTQDDMSSMRLFFQNNFPTTVKALKEIDNENMRPKRRKGVNLVPRESKKHGTIYLARFTHNGQKIKFNTKLSDPVLAEKWALENKERLIEQYTARKDCRMYTFLSDFYSEKTDNPEVCHLTKENRNDYGTAIENKFIPFLRDKKIVSFDQIKPIILTAFQDYLLTRGVRPQTANNTMKPVRKIFSYLTRKGIFAENPAERVKGITVRQTDRKARGCYELEKIQGVFNKRWKNKETQYLLCALIYTTGMRNSEINRIKMDDVIKIEGCHFIKIKESKTTSGIRLVPLHDSVYKKMASWAKKNKKTTLLFGFKSKKPFEHANLFLGKMLKVSEEEIKEENITFYSGRHYWKTLMSAEGLGEDIEEVFMGHKVGSSVKKIYNHHDKMGKRRLATKAKQVFNILDRCVFNKAARRNPRGRGGSGGAATA